MTSCTIPGRPHQAEAGLLVCRHHLDQMAGWLHDVEREVLQLDARPSMAIVWDRRGGTLASHQAPARLDAVALGDRRRVFADQVRHPAGFDPAGTLSIYGTLHGYAMLVRDGRLIDRPTRFAVERIAGTGHGPFCADCRHGSCQRMRWRHRIALPLTVATERQLLTRHLDWCAGQPWARDLWRDLRDLRDQLGAVNGTSDPRPLPGRCPWLVGVDECGGALWPVTPKHTSGALVHAGEEVVQAVECNTNPTHRWEDKALIRLALILDQQKEQTA